MHERPLPLGTHLGYSWFMQNIPTTAAVVTHEVESYERWKAAFDAHAPARKSAGITTAHINRDVQNPNQVSIYLAGTDAAKLGAFLESRDLANTMLDAGVKGPPSIAPITPVEDKTVKRATAAVIVRHAVKDYATWKRAFDDDQPARTAAGILGHAVNRHAKDANMVIVYLQADSIDQLHTFTSSPALKATMKNAGVEGAPVLSFVQGGTWDA